MSTVALALAAALGCARGTAPVPAESPPPAQAHADEGPLFLVLPLNVAAPMPVELEPYGPIVWEELERFLRQQGKALKTISRDAAGQLWTESTREVPREVPPRSRFEAAAGVLARKLRAHADFQALVVPSLFVREATLANRSARWDGVEREVRFVLRGIDARDLAERPLEGVAPAGSLHVAVFDPEGRRIHEAIGGLVVLVQVRVTGSNLSGQPTFQLEPRTDLPESRDVVREAIAVAFSPLLPPQAP